MLTHLFFSFWVAVINQAARRAVTVLVVSTTSYLHLLVIFTLLIESHNCCAACYDTGEFCPGAHLMEEDVAYCGLELLARSFSLA